MIPTHVAPRHKKIAAPVTTALQNVFPSAPTIQYNGAPHLVLPHTPMETALLRNMGFDAPAPILTHYDWPGGFKPFDVQRKTCAMLTMNERAYVLSAMGCGKTASAIWSADFLMTIGLVRKVLVVAPLSTLQYVWAREIFRLTPHRRYAVLHGDRKKRLAALANPEADIFIINHDGLKVIQEDITRRGDIDCLIIDELAVYRNGSSDRTKTIRKFAEGIRFVWGMTGSPCPNSPTDVWGQASVVTPGTVPKYFGRFRELLMRRVSQYQWVPKQDAVEQAFAVLQPAVRFTLDDIVELPECVERTIDIEMGAKQAKVYKQLVEHCHAQIAAHEITAANAGAVMSKLMQVSGGWVYSAEKGVVQLDNDNRIQVLLDLINDSPDKLLVFCNYKHALGGISAALTSEGIEHAVVSGDTPASERGEIFNLFENTEKYKVIVAHPQCMAHGITLVRAKTIIWAGPVLDLEIYSQANARIRRFGQKAKQQIIHLQSTPVEKRAYAMLQRKEKIQSRLLDLFEEASE